MHILFSKLAPGGGIANRMRTLLAYAEATRLRGFATPVMVWEANKHALPNEGAIAVDGVTIEEADRIEADVIPVPGALDMPIFYRSYGLPNPTRKEMVAAYRRVRFRDDIVAASVVAESCDMAVHVRMTDMASASRIPTMLAAVRERGAKKIYLACDEPSTIAAFSREFEVVQQTKFFRLPGVLRTSTTADACIDLMACARAPWFIGTKASSFSEMANRLREINSLPHSGI